MHSLTDIPSLNDNQSLESIYPYFSDGFGDSTYHYYHYIINQTTHSSSSIQYPSTTHCFDGTAQLQSCINIATFDEETDINSSITAYSNLYNFHKWSIIPQTLSIPMYTHNTNPIRISLTNYQSTSQCIEITNGNFPSHNTDTNSYYFIKGYILRSTNNHLSNSIQSIWNTSAQNPTQILKISTSASNINTTTNPTFNELFCFASTSSTDKYIHIELQVVAVFNDNTQYTIHPLTKTVIDSTQYTESIKQTLPLINHTITYYLNIQYYERCDIMNYFANVRKRDQLALNYQEIASNDQEIASKSATLSQFSSYFLLSICVITIIIIIIVSVTSKVLYPAGDPINYFSLIWMVLELWDFWSDVSFTVYLYIIFTFYAADHGIFFILLIIAIVCVVVPYILNIFYFNHLITLWSKNGYCCKAPQIWLKDTRYYIYFLMVTLITGSVFPAIEISNSLLIPCAAFAMRVPYFELVRVRTERFITNVLFENVPFLILQIIFYYAIKSLNSFVLMQTVGGFVFLGTVLSSVLSVLFNGTYYFSYKGKIALPIAIYKLDITLECEECSEYWQYSIWRMQTAISKAFGVSSPTLIVIDSCSITKQTYADRFNIKIHSRLLYDEAPFGNTTNIRLLLENRNVQSVTTYITDLFEKEFVNKPRDPWTNPTLRCSMTTITDICSGEGELVYNYHESIIKSVCCYICFRGKDGYKRSQRDVIASYKAKRRNSNQPRNRKKRKKRVKKLSKAHIRNVSDMKAAYSTSKGSTNIREPSISRSFKPRHNKNNLSVSELEFTSRTHDRLDSNISVSGQGRYTAKTSSTLDVNHAHKRPYNKPLPSLTYNKPLPSLYTPSSSDRNTNKTCTFFVDALTPPISAVHNRNNLSIVSLSPSTGNVELIEEDAVMDDDEEDNHGNEKNGLMLSTALNSAQNVIVSMSDTD